LNSLNYSGGDVAHYLSGLYTRQLQLLALANMDNSTLMQAQKAELGGELAKLKKVRKYL